MSRTYRKPLIKDLVRLQSWQAVDAKSLEDVLRLILLGFRDRAKTGWGMGSYRKDTWHDNKEYRAEKENYNRKMMQLEIQEHFNKAVIARKEARKAWWEEQCELAVEYDIYMYRADMEALMEFSQNC